MKKKILGRLILIGITVVLAIVFFLPNTPLFKHMPDWWRKNLPNKGIVLGLDLQGGIHLVYEVESEKAVEITTERIAQSLKSMVEKKKLTAEVTSKGMLITLTPASEEIKKAITDNYPILDVVESDTKLVYKISDKEAKRIKDNAANQALETIRNRVDQLGVSEPTIYRQGTNEIVIQLPGEKDSKRAIELVGKTALLEFKLVDDASPIAMQLPLAVEPGGEEDILKKFAGKIPADDEILFERVVTNREIGAARKKPILLKKQAVLTGDLLNDAKIDKDPNGRNYISISFNTEGSKRFEQVTGANIGKGLAIVLDNMVYSAPVIESKISGGSAMITRPGGFSINEANDLKIVLKAGALPAPLKMLQNITVGPSLGEDSIEAGKLAGLIGTILVILFMIIYYRLSGFIADFALMLNIVLLIGAMAALNATLTMPGIAGIILAIGMAVDSNVLMFERMRDELRAGKTPRVAVDSGYHKAFWTIFDSHVTTLITALVLYWFGTGPIKGFAVTLGLGVSINLFTALVGTKTVFDIINSRHNVQKLSI